MIYKDSLGRPNAEATISTICNVFTGECCYSLHSVSDCHKRRWSGDTTVDQIVAEMESDGWKCSVSADGYNRPRIDCIHIETQRVIDSANAAQAEKFANSERGYVRFGEIPECGRSRNHRDDTLELGVSCFDAEFAADGSFRLLVTPVLEVSYYSVCDRQAYRLYGERIGTGADGEPLLRVEKAVAL